MKEFNEKPVNPAQVSLILGISELTVKKLAKNGELPCTYINRQPHFDFNKIIEHFEELERSAG